MVVFRMGRVTHVECAPGFFTRIEGRPGLSPAYGGERQAAFVGEEPAFSALEYGGPEGAAPACAAVEVDAVAKMGGHIQGGVAVDHEPGVGLGIYQEITAQPEHIFGGLACERDAGFYACVQDQKIIGEMVKGQAGEPVAVFNRHRLEGCGVVGGLSRGGDAVGGERVHPAQALMQPGVARFDKARRGDGVVIEIIEEHLIVIAAQGEPVFALVFPRDQPVNHGFAVGAAIDVIAKEDDARIWPAIGMDQGECGIEHRGLTVDIGDDI